MENKIFYSVSINVLLFYKGACKEQVKCLFELALN
jgi:hypothetical protein